MDVGNGIFVSNVFLFDKFLFGELVFGSGGVGVFDGKKEKMVDGGVTHGSRFGDEGGGGCGGSGIIG